jgi:hypothetical protein
MISFYTMIFNVKKKIYPQVINIVDNLELDKKTIFIYIVEKTNNYNKNTLNIDNELEKVKNRVCKNKDKKISVKN